jgi:DNA-binding MarR family transcriptional regulator
LGYGYHGTGRPSRLPDPPRGQAAAARVREPCGGLRSHASKARALAFLARRPGANLTALAEALEVQPMSVLRVVDDLETQGMLRREPDPKDRRALRLSLTAAGESANAQIWQTLDGIVGEATQGMSAESLAGLVRGLKGLVAGMDRFVDTAPRETAR